MMIIKFFSPPLAAYVSCVTYIGVYICIRMQHSHTYRVRRTRSKREYGITGVRGVGRGWNEKIKKKQNENGRKAGVGRTRPSDKIGRRAVLWLRRFMDFLSVSTQTRAAAAARGEEKSTRVCRARSRCNVIIIRFYNILENRFFDPRRMRGFYMRTISLMY